jgi:cyclopropane fatty-acyl-phospholipid synthase-like methyltransferase
MTPAILNIQTAPGYEVFAIAGKTVLRPGGRRATQQLLQWADFKPGATVLELASGLGTSAIALAKRYRVRVIGIERNPHHLALAQARVKAAGLSDQVQIRSGNIFALSEIAETFDYVLAEAILTMQSDIGKVSIFKGIFDRLKSGGVFLCHEAIARHHPAELHRDLAEVLRVNATPLSVEDWITTVESTGFQVQQQQTGAMQLLNPRQVIQDEGVFNTLQIAWNLLTQPPLRKRLLSIKQVFSQHQQDLGYIIFTAMKESAS